MKNKLFSACYYTEFSAETALLKSRVFTIQICCRVFLQYFMFRYAYPTLFYYIKFREREGGLYTIPKDV